MGGQQSTTTSTPVQSFVAEPGNIKNATPGNIKSVTVSTDVEFVTAKLSGGQATPKGKGIRGSIMRVWTDTDSLKPVLPEGTDSESEGLPWTRTPTEKHTPTNEPMSPMSPRQAAAKQQRRFLEVGFGKSKLAGLIKKNVISKLDEPAKVLIIYSGGTIGMEKTVHGYAPVLGSLQKTMKSNRIFQDPDCAQGIMPKNLEGRHTQYRILEYDPLLDSSSMTPRNWVSIAKDIIKHYKEYDGFVVLHGTDTMAYTASALSFMLGNIDKPVVITGSQIPIAELRSDATENLLGSLLVAGHCRIPEVTLFFRSKLFRGSRTRKCATSCLEAFDSPNLGPLAVLGIDVEVNRDLVLPAPRAPLIPRITPCEDVAIVQLFPGIRPAVIAASLAAPVRGAVLLTFGAGNAPESKEFLGALSEACDRGVVIVNISQCGKGGVNMECYAAGSGLSKAGVIGGGDMTIEATLCKLMIVLGTTTSSEAARAMMKRNVCGEMSGRVHGFEDDRDDDDDRGLEGDSLIPGSPGAP